MMTKQRSEFEVLFTEDRAHHMRRLLSILAVFFALTAIVSCRPKGFRSFAKPQPPTNWSDAALQDTLRIMPLDSIGGYVLGDIVRVRTILPELVRGDVVFVRLRDLYPRGSVWGPPYVAGQIVGMPGDRYTLFDLVYYKARDGKQRTLERPSWNIVGLKLGYDSTSLKQRSFALPTDTFLLQLNYGLLVIGANSVRAVVVSRFCHDYELEMQLRGTVY